MIDKTQIRYIACHSNHVTGKFSFNLFPDNDTLAIAELGNAKAIYPQIQFGQEDDDLRILSVLISPALEQEFSYQVDLENPMSDENEMATVHCLDIARKTFRSLATVKVAYPQTDGFFEITSTDDDGVETVTQHDKMQECNWAGVSRTD